MKAYKNSNFKKIFFVKRCEKFGFLVIIMLRIRTRNPLGIETKKY